MTASVATFHLLPSRSSSSSSTRDQAKEEEGDVEVHLLPCKISHDGPAKVSAYFVTRPFKGTANPDEDLVEVVETSSSSSPLCSRSSSESANDDEVVGGRKSLQQAAFRGRRLLGQTVKLPFGTSGLVMRRDMYAQEEAEEMKDVINDRSMEGEDDDDERDAGAYASSASEKRMWRVEGGFSQITYWNHDALPKPEDCLHKWMEFVEVSRALHG